MDNKALAFFQEYQDVISLEVFKSESSEYRLYLEEIIVRRNKLLQIDFTENEKAFRQYKSLERQISIMMGFLGIVETTFQVLSEKVYNHLNFDANAWERYRALQQESDLWLEYCKNKLQEVEK